MLAIHRHGGAVGADILGLLMPPDIAVLLDINLNIGPLGDDYAFDLGAASEGVIDILFDGNDLPSAVAGVGGDDNFRATVGKAVLDAFAAEAAENHGVDGADAGATEHGNDGFGNERHVDQNAVAFFDAVPLEDIREHADFAVELLVGEGLFVAGFAFPNDRSLVAARAVEMAVEAVLAGVELSTDEPLGVGEFPVQDLLPLFAPDKIRSLASPEFLGVLERFRVEFFVFGKGFDLCRAGDFFRGFENAGLFLVEFGVFSHRERGGDLMQNPERLAIQVQKKSLLANRTRLSAKWGCVSGDLQLHQRRRNGRIAERFAARSFGGVSFFAE